MKRYVKSAEGVTSKQRAKIARESTDPKELKRLAYDNAKSVRVEVLKNEHTPDKENIMLSKEFMNGSDKQMRNALARYSRDPHVLAELSNDSDEDVRGHIGCNKSTADATLDKLSQDSKYYVRENVARNPNISKAIQMRLAGDNDIFVLSSLATNPNLCQDAAEIMLTNSKCDSYDIARALESREISDEFREQFYTHPSGEVRAAALKCNMKNDPDIITQFVHDKSKDVQRVIAEYAEDLDIITELANSSDWFVRSKVAARINNIDVLKILAKDDDKWVRRSAKARLKELKPTPLTTSNTDWSIPLYSINNYTEIEDEINKVIDQAANLYSKQYHGTTAHITVPEGVYDDNGKITIDIGNESYEIDADDILAPATSKNKKADCIKTLVKWMEANFN